MPLSRGAAPFAHIAGDPHRPLPPRPGAGDRERRAQFEAFAPHYDPDGAAVISGASGVAAPTREEQAFLASLGLPVRASATAHRHVAGAVLSRPAWRWRRWRCSAGRCSGRWRPPKQPMTAPLRQALVTSWGHWRGEALALVTAA